MRKKNVRCFWTYYVPAVLTTAAEGRAYLGLGVVPNNYADRFTVVANNSYLPRGREGGLQKVRPSGTRLPGRSDLPGSRPRKVRTTELDNRNCSKRLKIAAAEPSSPEATRHRRPPRNSGMSENRGRLFVHDAHP